MFRNFVDRDDCQIMILAGAAGTGKTELIAEFCRLLASAGRLSVLLAPTGQAARRLARRTGVGARTVHSQVFGLGDVVDKGDEVAPQTVFPINLVEKPPMDAVIIVDESSFVSNEPLDDAAKEHAELIFGSTNLLADLLEHAAPRKVVFVGDPNQLPPIGLDTAPALQPATFEEMGLAVVAHELLEIHRRAHQSPITELGWRLAESIRLEDPNANLEVRHEPEAGVEVLDVPRLDTANIGEFLEGSATVVSWSHVNVAHWNGAVRRLAGRPLDTPVQGDRMILAKTCLRPYLPNGEEIEVLAVDDGVDVIEETIKERSGSRSAKVRVAHGLFRIVGSTDPDATFSSHFVLDGCYSLDSDRQSVIRRVLWIDFLKRAARNGLTRRDGRVFWDFYFADSRAQALLVSYSYARTIHKSQGGEWDHVLADLSAVRGRSALSRRLSYTAVTRAKGRLGIYAWPFAVRFIDLDEICRVVVERLRVELSIDAVVTVIQSGRQIRSAAGDLVVNIYERDRRLGSVTVQKCPEGAGDMVVNVLREVELTTRSRLQPPVEPSVLERTERLAAILFEQGLDLHSWSPGDYQIAFAVRSGSTEAVAGFHHNASGQLGKQLAVAGGADPVLADLLRVAISEAWS